MLVLFMTWLHHLFGFMSVGTATTAQTGSTLAGNIKLDTQIYRFKKINDDFL